MSISLTFSCLTLLQLLLLQESLSSSPPSSPRSFILSPFFLNDGRFVRGLSPFGFSLGVVSCFRFLFATAVLKDLITKVKPLSISFLHSFNVHMHIPIDYCSLAVGLLSPRRRAHLKTGSLRSPSSSPRPLQVPQ